MDQSTLVEDQIYHGRRFVERFAADGHPVHAAFWALSEEGTWFLHVVTGLVDRVGPVMAYRAVNASLQRLGASCISGSEVKVISPNKPIAKSVLDLMTRQTAQSAIHVAGAMRIDQMYIYPRHVFTMNQPNQMTTDEISREILHLMNRGAASLQWSRVALKDGSAFEGVPFSLQVGSRKPIEVHFTVEGNLKPVVIGLDEIAAIN